MLNTALIIDNDTRLLDKLRVNIQDNLKMSCKVMDNFDEKKETYEDLGAYGVYIIRHNSKNKKLINYLIDEEKIVIVLTARDDEKTRKEILAYCATDYIVTNSSSNSDMVVNTIQRIKENTNLTVMIVDDSSLILNTLAILLETQNLNFIKFVDGEKAWNYLNNSKSNKIDLIISDYEMPNMNGYELVKKVRTKFNIEELPVLILSGTENTDMIARFLKAGANDYIPKPFINEEFLARVSNTLDIVRMFKKIKNMATTDFLTGLHNRIFFYETGLQVLKLTKRHKDPMSISMIDIDNFKKFNDTYGHEVGDRALKHVAKTLSDSVRESDICVRFGGEEFVVLLPNCANKQAMRIMQNVCKKIEESKLIIDDNLELTVTISAGVTSVIDDLDNMLNKADTFMYKAKENGKNQAYSDE